MKIGALSCWLIILLTACSTLKHQELSHLPHEQLMQKVVMLGEGRGRLGLGQREYLFSFDSVLQPPSDWLMAVSLPLHGEEILKLNQLNQEYVGAHLNSDFGRRIEMGIVDFLRQQKKSPLLATRLIKEFRKLMRFLLYREFALKLNCRQNGCGVGDDFYEFQVKNQKLLIKKNVEEDFQLEFVAENLTNSGFKKTQLVFHSYGAPQSSGRILSLELFWQ